MVHFAGASAPPSHILQGDDLTWLDLILVGALPPRYERPASEDVVAPLLPTLQVADSVGPEMFAAGHLELFDPEGVLLARLHLDDAKTQTLPWLAGKVEAVSGFDHLDHADWRQPPRVVASDWSVSPVVALWQRAPVPFAVREATRNLARELGGAVLEVLPVASGQETSQQGNLSARLAHHETTRDRHDRPVVLPAPALSSRPCDLLLQAQVVASYGATTLALTPLQWAALGEAADKTLQAAAAFGVELVRLNVDPAHCQFSGNDLDALVAEGHDLPDWFAEPAVATELRRLHRSRMDGGLTVLLSGLSGSGKSTVAKALAVRLMETEFRSVTLLDGDVVRHHLSKGLGFSRADRDINVRRIGFVASEITKAGGIAICCPIAPYDATRRDVRAMVEAEGGFVLVHVATPLEECERRDRKGLYAKARRGEIPEFTGISDPYEIPQDAEVVVDTTGRTIESCVDEVMAALRRLGYIN